MFKLRLRYIFLIAMMVLAIQGSPKPYQEDTEDESEKSGFWTLFGMLVDYFYDDDEDYGDETDQYLICRNCTVVLNQNATQSGGGGETTTGPTPVPGPSTTTETTESAITTSTLSPILQDPAGQSNGPAPGTVTPAETTAVAPVAAPGDTPAPTAVETPSGTQAINPGGTPPDSPADAPTPAETTAGDNPANGE